MNKLVVSHVLSFICALLIASVIIKIYPSDFIKYNTPSKINSPNNLFYLNISNSYKTELLLRENLQKHSIIVFGSSELGMSYLPAIPYNFFTKKVHYPCYAFGHEGSQCFCMFSQFAAINDELKDGKLVIMLSPAWFSKYPSKGTPLQVFLESINERFLYYIWYDVKVPQEFKNYIGDYIVQNYNHIESPSAILRLIYYTSKSQKNITFEAVLSPVIKSLKKYCDYKREKYTVLYFEHYTAEPLIKQSVSSEKINKPKKIKLNFNFDSLSIFSKICFDTISNNNTWGMENSHFSHLFPNKKSKTLGIVGLDDNKEFKDFLMLLKLLKYYNCRPLFVMQPLNPYAYNNLNEFDPTIQSALKAIKENGFDCYNMFSTDITSYQKGTLNDVQHLGNVGWYKVDKNIIDYFKLKNE